MIIRIIIIIIIITIAIIIITITVIIIITIIIMIIRYNFPKGGFQCDFTRPQEESHAIHQKSSNKVKKILAFKFSWKYLTREAPLLTNKQ